MTQEEPRPTNVVRSLGRNVLAMAMLAGGGKLLANIIINTATGGVSGHIDAGCAVDVSCTNMVLDTVKSLPYLIPALLPLGKGVKFVVDLCSHHPDGGRNQSISGKIE